MISLSIFPIIGNESTSPERFIGTIGASKGLKIRESKSKTIIEVGWVPN